jgi:hypothetical protein
MTIFTRSRQTHRASGYRHSPAVTIRWASPDDAERLEVLAELDEAPAPSPPLLLGLVGDELWVALSLCTGAMIADPFRPSAEVAALVSQRGRQLMVPEPRQGGSRSAGRSRASLARGTDQRGTPQLGQDSS